MTGGGGVMTTSASIDVILQCSPDPLAGFEGRGRKGEEDES